MEFRCKIRDLKLERIYQRHPNCTYPFLLEPEVRNSLTTKVNEFFEERVLPTLKTNQITKDLTMDIFVTNSNRIFLFGIRPIADPSSEDFPLEEFDETSPQLVAVRSDQEASRKVWGTELPAEFMQMADQPGGMQEFIASMKEHLGEDDVAAPGHGGSDQSDEDIPWD